MADRSVIVRLGAQIEGLRSGLDEAARKAKETAAQIEAAGKKADAALDSSAKKLPLLTRAHDAFAAKSASVSTWLGKNRDDVDRLATSGLIMGGLMAAGAAMAVKKYADFDAQMSAVKSTGDEARASFGALRDAAVRMGADTVFSATEAAAGIENLLKAGVSARDVLGGGLKGALDLAAAGQLSVAAAAEVAATAMVQFNLSGKDVPHIADLLAAGAGKAQGEVSDLAAALGQSGLVASQFGLSVEETVGSLAAFAAAGLTGSDAGTSMKTALLKLANPSQEAATLMGDLGIAAYDAGGNFVGMAGMAGQLQAALKDKTQAERDSALATIFGSDAIRIANVLYKEGADGITEWTTQVNDAGYAGMVAATRLDNLRGDVEKLSGSIDTVMIQSGSGLNDFFRGMVQGAERAVDALGKVPGPILGIAATLTGAGGLAVAGVSGIAKLATIGNDAAEAFKRLGASAKTAKVAVGLVGGVLAIGAIALTAWATAAADAKASSEAFQSTLVVVDGAVLTTASTMAQINDQLANTKTGLFGWGPSLLTLMSEVGVSAKDAQGYMLGNAAATDRVTAAMDAYQSSITASSQGTDDGAGSVASLTMGLDGLRNNLTAAQRAALEKSNADKEAEIATTSLTDAYTKTTAATQDGTTALAEYGKQLKEATAEALALSNTQIGFEQAIDDSKKAVKELVKATKEKKDLQDLDTQAGRDAMTILNGLADKTASRTQKLIEQNAAESEVVSTMNRGRKAFVDRARDLGFTESAIADLVAEYGMIPESVTTIVGQAGAAPAATQVSTLKDALKGLPKDTQTDVLSIFNTKGIDAAYTALSEIDGEKADAWIKSILERSGIKDWDSYKPKSKDAYINTYVNTYKTVYTGMAGRWQKSADGGMYGAGMVQEFADGGFPSIGSQQPQIQPNHGPGGIRWAEEGAGPWEAFVSGHPAKRARSRMIAAEAVGRLGGDVAWANADGNLMKSALYQHQPVVQSPAGTGGRSADPVSAISAAAIREALNGARLELSGADAFSDTIEARIVTSIRRA